MILRLRGYLSWNSRRYALCFLIAQTVIWAVETTVKMSALSERFMSVMATQATISKK